MMYENVVRDFALRTRENLQAIEKCRSEGKEVFEATQLINSMLGLLVFPQQEYIKSIPRTPLEDLRRDGWVIPEVRQPFRQARDLNELIRYLRNAVAHFNIKFIGDGNDRIAMIKVWNHIPARHNGGRVQKNWEAELSLDDLRKLTNKFIDMLLEDTAG